MQRNPAEAEADADSETEAEAEAEAEAAWSGLAWRGLGVASTTGAARLSGGGVDGEGICTCGSSASAR